MDLVRSHRVRPNGHAQQVLFLTAMLMGTALRRVATAAAAPTGPPPHARLTVFAPAALRDVHFLAIALWQWLGLAVVAALALLIGLFVGAVAGWLLRPVVNRLHASLARRVGQLLLGPTRLVSAVAAFYVGSFALGLSGPVQRFFNGALEAIGIGAVTWLCLRCIDLLIVRIDAHLAARRQAAAAAMLPLGRRAAHLVVTATALLVLLENFGFNVTGLIAGLGVGGLAVALAAQETVKNFFGGVALIANQPVRVGDFCRFGEQAGTVEDISLWATRIRTLDRTVISIPNAVFSGMQLENFARRDRVWLHATIGLRYETTPDQLRYVLVELKKMLVGHPKIDVDPARVRFVRFNASSIDLEIFAYALTADYDEFLAVQEDVFLRIMDIVEAAGAGFAGQGSSLDDGKRRAAEAQVQQWRAQNALYLPYFPPEKLAEINNRLDYPPAGSAVRT